MSKTYNYQVAGTFDVSTTGNIDDLDFQKCAVIRMTNATLATIRGLKAGYPGQTVTIVSTGAGQVNLAHQNTNSAAANRLINFVTSGITPLAAASGAGTYTYDETTARWRLVDHVQGAAIDIAYAAGNFTASTGTWTFPLGATNQAVFKYLITGTKLDLVFQLDLTSVSAAPLLLQITLPNGYVTVAGNVTWFMIYNDNATGWVPTGQLVVGGASSTVFLEPTGAPGVPTWSISVALTSVRGIAPVYLS